MGLLMCIVFLIPFNIKGMFDKEEALEIYTSFYVIIITCEISNNPNIMSYRVSTYRVPTLTIQHLFIHIYDHLLARLKVCKQPKKIRKLFIVFAFVCLSVCRRWRREVCFCRCLN